MGSWALVKDGVVINTITWDGQEISPVEFDKGVDAIEIEEGMIVSTGYSYKKGIFEAPPLTEEQKEEIIENKKATNYSLKQALMNEASQRISVLQDAVELEMATDEEAAALPLWKKYRVLLSRIDANTSDEVKWPEVPSF